jgi:hypothetical protein
MEEPGRRVVMKRRTKDEAQQISLSYRGYWARMARAEITFGM